LTFQAQDSRSRDANAEDNRRKLIEEVTSIYKDVIPAETSAEKKKKHEEMSVASFVEKQLLTSNSGRRFHETRIKHKKFTSAKKQSRRGPSD
jgi:peptidyl-tRNA hydrolase ICT1